MEKQNNMTAIIYLTIGLLYWALNSFVRKLEINGDWMLPLVWFLLWPIAFATWMVIFLDMALTWIKNKNGTRYF
ncbi:MAG: hypothetical protein EBR30_01545 [Cytophagia bacterium]|nr:hypothetical protein [Cytophagia bacterium]